MDILDYDYVLSYDEEHSSTETAEKDIGRTYLEDPSFPRGKLNNPLGSPPNIETGCDSRAVQNSMDYAKAIETLDRDGEDLADEVFQLREENELHIQAISRLQQDNRKLAGEIARLRAESNQKSSDEYFVKTWDSLKYRISNWAFKHFQDRPKIPKGSAMDRTLTDLVHDTVSCMGSDRLRLLLVQSLVWRQLEFSVLHKNAVLWAGQHRQALRELSQAIEQMTETETRPKGLETRDLYRWRALTAAVLPLTVDQKVILEVTYKIVDKISSKLLPYSASSADNASKFRKELEDIVLESISLCLDFDQQRAQFKVVRAEGRNGEESDFWADIRGLQIESGAGEDKGECFVSLVVVPGLHRFGDADGGSLDQEVIVAKCVVESSKFRGKRQEVRAARIQKERAPQVEANGKVGAVQQAPKRRMTAEEVRIMQSQEQRSKQPAQSIPRKGVPGELQKRPTAKSDRSLDKESKDSGKSGRSFGERAKRLFSAKAMDEEKDQSRPREEVEKREGSTTLQVPNRPDPSSSS